MGKTADKKRKLEQEQADNTTPKRLKPTTNDSAKKATSTANGGNDSPMVLVSRSEKPESTNGTPKLSKADKKAAKKARKSDIQATPGAQLRAESDDVVTPVEKAKNLEKQLAKQQADTKAAEPSAKKSKAKSNSEKRRNSKPAKEVAVQAKEGPGDTEKILVEVDEAAAQRAADKKARRKARRQGQVVPEAELRQEILTPKEKGWTLSTPSAGRYLGHDPIFVADENGDACLIAATMREIQLLSLDTSLPVRSHILPEGRHVVAYSRSPANEQTVDIAYDNGSKVSWNWTTSEITNGTFPGQESVIAMASAIMADEKRELFYITEAEGEFSVVGERKVQYTTNRRLDGIQVLHNGAYVVCTSGGAVVIGARKDPSPQADYTWMDVPFGVPIRCADAKLVFKDSSRKNQKRRPELMLAVGTAEGKIFLYPDVSSIFRPQAEALKPQVLHWHREKLCAVKFSRDGNYLISGGKETVLVLWQLETGKQQFLPHLTAEIEHIVVSPEGNQYALQMGDNSIMVLSTSELKPVANFAGLQLPVKTALMAAEEAELPKASALLHPQDQHKLLLTVPATQPKSSRDVSTRPFVQTFDVRNSRHLARQALARNNVTDFNTGPDDTPIIPPDVALAAISADGQWMATVDEWIIPGTDLEHLAPKRTGLDSEERAKLGEEQEKRREVHLKFWRWDATQQIWTLSTRIDAPHSVSTDEEPKHGAGRVLKLAADPSSNTFATVGQDSIVKIWTPRKRLRGGEPVQEADGTDAIDYACKRSVAVPVSSPALSDPSGKRQDSPMDVPDILDGSGPPVYLDDATLAFSPDGSILACAQVSDKGTTLPLVHFIETDTGILKASKAGLTVSDQEIVDIGFLDRYFITLSTGSLRLWDLVKDTAHYTVALQGDGHEQDEAMLAVNHIDGTFAVVSLDIQEVSDPQPRVSVYGPKTAGTLFEARLSAVPVALLAPQNGTGYTILFEDATIRTLSPTPSFSSALVPATQHAPKNAPVAQTSAEITSALALAGAKEEEDIEMDDAAAFAFASGDVTSTRQAIENDKPVVRPEQLNAILDVGQAFAMPALTDLFQSLSTLHSRAPRRRKDAMEVETA